MVDRGQIVKSAGIAGILVSASVLSGSPSRASTQFNKRSEQSKHQSRPSAGLRKRIMGFMLPHGQLPVPRLADGGGDWPVSAESSDHMKLINELFDSSATIVNIHSGQADQVRVIDFYGREVLPLLKRSKTDSP